MGFDPADIDVEKFVLDYASKISLEPNTGAYRWDAESPPEIKGIIAAMRLANHGKRATREQAARDIQKWGYRLDFVRDIHTFRNYLLIHEADPKTRGWGMYILRYDESSAPANLAIEVPHPVDDQHTASFGIKVFLRLDGKMFAMAGANRNANVNTRPGYPHSRVSDMARSYESLFHKVHCNFTTPSPHATHVVQPHGFIKEPAYPSVVLSTGDPHPTEKISLLAKNLRAKFKPKHISVGVFDGTHYADFGGTINPQGKHIRKKGGYFYHIEATHAVRSNPATYQLVSDAMWETFFSGLTGAPGDMPEVPGFDRVAAVTYARGYATHHNPVYHTWTDDCTNFVSQALYAANWAQAGPPLPDPISRRETYWWYYDSGDPVNRTSWTWVNADYWKKFAKDYSGRVQKVKYLSDVGPGDIVQYAGPQEREMAHTMIVTTIDEAGPRISEHSHDRVDRSLWAIYKEYERNAFYAWRTVKCK